MLKISFSLNPSIRDTLLKLDVCKKEILLTPITPKTEIRLRWETIARKVFARQNPYEALSKSSIIKLLGIVEKKNFSISEQNSMMYRHGLAYISEEYLASGRQVTYSTIEKLIETSFSVQTATAVRRKLRSVEPQFKQLLEYLQVRPEHPLITGAIAYLVLGTLGLWEDEYYPLAFLLTYLFLYKYGYDVRGLTVLEEVWNREQTGVQKILEETVVSGNYTLWLEYAGQSLLGQMEKIKDQIAASRFTTDLPSNFWDLSSRQKIIFRLLDQPEKSLTNKEIQKLFKVSQITASRDLSKLTTLGLLISHGKGRSVSYSRA